MTKNKFTKAKEKWFKTRVKEAKILFQFNEEFPHEEVCRLYVGDYWTFSSNAKFDICKIYIVIKDFFWYMEDRFFTSRKLAFKNPKVKVEYKTFKTIEKERIKILKEEGLIE